MTSGHLALFIFVLGLSSLGRAVPSCGSVFRPEFLFGLEFTFTREDLVQEGRSTGRRLDLASNPRKAEVWLELRSHLERVCAQRADCRLVETQDKHGRAVRLEYRDGFYFTIGLDVMVLESNAKPLTPSQFEKVLPRFEKDLFEPALALGLRPHARIGGGHIHISKQAFEGNALAFRNFFVDFQNRPELAFGAFGAHLGNSPPLAALRSSQREALYKLLQEFDSEPKGWRKIWPRRWTIEKLAHEIEKRVYTHSTNPQWGAPHYYQALNLNRLQKPADQATLEIRSFRPQESPRAFLLQTRLLEAWINKMKSLEEPIAYKAPSRIREEPQEIVDSYAQLLRDLNLPFSEFRDLLPPHLRSFEPSH